MVNKVTQDGDFYNFRCPHCSGYVIVPIGSVNCRIFRHASYFQVLPHLPLINGNYQYIPTTPINPHTSKEQCDQLVAEGRVLGCAKPFRFVYSPDGNNYVEKCDYL